MDIAIVSIMKKYILYMALIIGFILVVLSSWSWRWILFHGWAAEKLANHLLAGDSQYSDDEFIDYTIYTADSCVIFSTHDEEDRAMVYCPHATRTTKIGSLEHILGSWYRQAT